MNEQIKEMEKLQDELIKRSCTEFNNKTSMLLTSAAKAVGLLLETYRKQSEGEWIRKDGFQVCSNCDATKPIAFSTVLKITYYKCDYCPKCGAKMKGGAE